jgi:Tfp pilus assembly protein PilX
MTLFNRQRITAGALQRQRGVVLMVALIVLVALTLAGLSMVRSADAGIVVAGNLSFRQAASQAMDAGVEAAVTGIQSDLGLSGNPVAGKYYAYMLADGDGDGVPDGINWNNAYSITDPGGLTGYTVRYVVERMCFAGAAIGNDLDAEGRCNMEQKSPGFQSNKLGSADLGEFRKINYRITVKVEGPRNTETFASAVISK